MDEIPLYPPAGEGAHTFVRVEKRGRTTEEVARALARFAGVRPGDVGYAGRKDRGALARQWLSVPGLDPDRACDFGDEGVRVLEARRHPHKLRTGQLAGNRFELVVRGLAPEQVAGAAERLAACVREGMPNRFGAQRFGDGSAAARARALLAGGPVPRNRRGARFWLSALQAELFNAVLAARPLPPGALEDGDVAMRHDSGASFLVEDAAREAPRAAAFEISPTGPVFACSSPPVRPASGSARPSRPWASPGPPRCARPAASGCAGPGGPCACARRTRASSPPAPTPCA